MSSQETNEWANIDDAQGTGATEAATASSINMAGAENSDNLDALFDAEVEAA